MIFDVSNSLKKILGEVKSDLHSLDAVSAKHIVTCDESTLTCIEDSIVMLESLLNSILRYKTNNEV